MPLTDHMPTGARLVVGVCFAAVGWHASQMIRPLMTEGTDFGWFNEVNVVLGLICGWVVTGSRLGRGYPEGISAGLTGMGALVFWALFLQSFNEMLKLALERRYDGPVEALIAVFEIGIDYGLQALYIPLIGFLLGASFLIGLIGEWCARRW
ncbi:TrgA family protein [Roseovarius sp. EL26]|uniref:TrgA family protein n=1 Tax=Roseovarius sp. EL26 TaxID=2126672 RepID=UPI000EA3F049|nr:TrgA family protein [Roseovarius sp. EL26]